MKKLNKSEMDLINGGYSEYINGIWMGSPTYDTLCATQLQSTPGPNSVAVGSATLNPDGTITYCV